MPQNGDLESIPLIDDFVIELYDVPDSGKHLAFVSRSRGRLAAFPAWDHVDRDLRHFSPPDVPIGTVDRPYDDRDDAWRINIFEQGGLVYVFEADEPDATDFPRRFRTSRDRYLQAWAAMIDSFNPIKSLDDAIGDQADAFLQGSLDDQSDA